MNRYHINIFLILLFLSLSSSKILLATKNTTKENAVLKEKTVALFSQKGQLSFQENKGQLRDEKGNPIPYVLFKAEVDGFNLWVTTTGLTYQFIKQEKQNDTKKEWQRVDMVLKEATIKKENVIVENELSQGVINYFLGNSSNEIRLKSYKKVIIQNIYEGIDWQIYIDDTKTAAVKQDFIVHPNADPNKIKLVYEGCGKINIKRNQIHVENQLGELQEGKLYCYQGNEVNKIKSNYTIQQNAATSNLGAGNFQSIINTNTNNIFSYEIGIKTDHYNKNQTLVIDPELVWGTFFGGGGGDNTAKSVEVDGSGNLVVVGSTQTTAFPVLNAGGASFYQGTSAGLTDAFILKFNNSGELLWSTFYGGGGSDEATDICMDTNGNIFISGNTTSIDFPVLNPGGTTFYQPAKQGISDAFVLKFNSSGELKWATYLGGLGEDTSWSICCDPTGNVFFTGYTSSADFPLMPSGAAYYDNSYGGAGDVFIVKCDNTGALLWSTYYGGSAEEQANAITSDEVGNIYVVGKTASSDFPAVSSVGYYQAAYAGGITDAFILKMNNSGVRQWATYYGGSASESANSVQCDALGNIFVAGNVDSPDFPTQNLTGAYYQSAIAGKSDAFILKFDTTDNRTWASYYGGAENELFYSNNNLTIDKCNNVYLSFNTASSELPLQESCSSEFNDNSLSGFSDHAIIKFSNNGINRWATFVGGDGNDLSESIVLDNKGNLFIASGVEGVLNDASYPITDPGAGAYYDNTYNSANKDIVIAKFRQVKPFFTQTQVNATACNICDGSATITLTCGNPLYSYIWSNGSQTVKDSNSTNTISNLCPGIYIVKALSDCYDTITATFTIIGLNPPAPINLNVSACDGSTYTLPDSSTTTFSGVYIHTFQTPSGCDSTIITTLNFVNQIVVSKTVNLCSGKTYTLPGGAIVDTAGVFINMVPAPGGCDSVITTTIIILPTSASTQSSIICAGKKFTLPNGSFADTSETYTNILTAANGCDSIVTTNLTVTPALMSIQTPSICAGNSFILPGGTSVNITGTYVNTIPNFQGCDSIITTILTVNNLPIFVSGPSLVLNCTTTSGKLFVSSSTSTVTYSWAGPGIVSGGNTDSVTANTTGTYTVTITDTLTGCINTATNIVTTTGQAPSVSVLPLILPCNINTGIISANSTTSGVIYNWSGPGILSGGNTASPTVNAVGTYTVTVLDPHTNCTSTASVSVTNTPSPLAGVSPDVTIQQGSNTLLTATGGVTYNWIPTVGLNSTLGNSVIAHPIQTTRYCVEVRDNNGCSDTACVNVVVEKPCPLVAGDLAVPNAFSPNADGVNDEFCLQGWDACIEDFTIIIFDRWGEKVFESKDPNFCWDGKNKGKQMGAGVFVYYIHTKYKNMNGSIEKRGNISLIR